MWKHLGFHAAQSGPHSDVPLLDRFCIEKKSGLKRYHRSHPLHPSNKDEEVDSCSSDSSEDFSTYAFEFQCPGCAKIVSEDECIYCEVYCMWPFHKECLVFDGSKYCCGQCSMMKEFIELKEKYLHLNSSRSLLWVGRKLNHDKEHNVFGLHITSILTGRYFTTSIRPSTIPGIGNGLFIHGSVVPGDLIAYWRGLPISEHAAKRSLSAYLIQRTDGQWLDGRMGACLGKYANHRSCPNAYVKDFNDISGEKLVGIYARIPMNDCEVFISYDWLPDRDKVHTPWFSVCECREEEFVQYERALELYEAD
ncbi:hypothetical protein P9112_010426 [Eukaryota sp. TZLM1-RC]